MRRMPPGPRWPMFVQTFLAIFFTERFNAYCQRHFKSLVTVRMLGIGKVVSVWDPELIKTIFTAEPDGWRAGEANAPFLQPAAGPNSVLVLDGERHLRMRRMLLPPFHGEAVRRYTELVTELTAQEVERWPLDEEFSLHPCIQEITLEVILRAVIGVRDEHRLDRLRATLKHVAGANLFAFWAESAFPRLARSSVGSRLRWISARREADKLIYEEIAAHRLEPEGRDDVLALLLAAGGEDGAPLSDEELRDQIVTLLVAGHETTATALTWCFERLLRHPACLERLQKEVAEDTGDAYLDAVINETLRARPVIDQATRKLTNPTELGGYDLPAGTVVAASILGVQLSDAYDDPQEFCPERFLGKPAAPYTLIPFGGGVRRCVGASFALMEMKAILRTVTQRVELRVPTQKSERPERWRRFTVTPSRGGRVIVAARRSPPEEHLPVGVVDALVE